MSILDASNGKVKCACGGDARPGQRNCYACHAVAQRRHRERRNEELRKFREMFAQTGKRRAAA